MDYEREFYETPATKIVNFLGPGETPPLGVRTFRFPSGLERPPAHYGAEPTRRGGRVWDHHSGSRLKAFNDSDSHIENCEAAFRFFNWFLASSMPPTSAIVAKAQDFCERFGIPTVKALNEGVNEQGGALVPPEFDNILIRLIEKFGVFRRRARINQMANDTKTVGRRTGGVTATWVGEGQTIGESQPTYDSVQLVAKKLAAMVVMSSEVREDSAIDLADELAFEFAQAFAQSEDQAGFNGDASPTFGGITGICPKLKALSGTIANIAGLFVASGNLFSEFLLTDFNNTVALLPQFADTAQTAWYCHRKFYYGTMAKLALAAGGNTAREVQDGARDGRPLFLGYPVEFAQVMPAVDANSQIACVLGDLSLAAQLGDRRQRTLFVDPFTLSARDQIQIIGRERLDIVINDVGNAASAAADKAPGPIVALISAAS